MNIEYASNDWARVALSPAHECAGIDRMKIDIPDGCRWNQLSVMVSVNRCSPIHTFNSEL